MRDKNVKLSINGSTCSDFYIDEFNATATMVNDAIVKNVATVSNIDLLKYQSPITIVTTQLRNQMENNILKVVQDMGIDVDKEELKKALFYDREQYTKGYQDAKNEFGKYATWHSCEDCLPNIGEQVLVQTFCDTIHTVFFMGTSECWGENVNLCIRPSMVSYWAPLLPVKKD